MCPSLDSEQAGFSTPIFHFVDVDILQVLCAVKFSTDEYSMATDKNWHSL
jgi:hypothetical protein